MNNPEQWNKPNQSLFVYDKKQVIRIIILFIYLTINNELQIFKKLKNLK